jgi:anti-anti-sigma regulatory factor
MKRCRQQGGDLHLCGLQQPVRFAFALTRLDRAIEIFPDEEQAVKAFGSGRHSPGPTGDAQHG